MNNIELFGCTDEPMINYLKALGIFRLVHKQKDRAVKGYWKNGYFCFKTSLSSGELEHFFKDEYSPSPFFVPWGARSGFWKGNSEKSARAALENIIDADDLRFDTFRKGFFSIKEFNERHSFSNKPAGKKEKDAYISLLRSEADDNVREWIDACYALTQYGSEVMFLLGTGGNEGSGSYSKSYMEALNLVLLEYSPKDLNNSLLATLYNAYHCQEKGLSCGQLNPSTAQTDLLNPWDVVLALEGALFFVGSATKKYNAKGRASFPFTVSSSLAGAGHLSEANKSEFSKEFWMPIWNTPSRFQEIEFLFREGKANFGKKKAKNGLDFALSISSLGVDRGIFAFKRYGRMERNGQSNIAVALGKSKVRKVENVELIGDFIYWLERLRISSNNDNAPARYRKHLHRVEDSIFYFAKRGDKKGLQRILIELGKAEHSFSRAGSNRPVPPLNNLTPQWIPACDDGSAEYRLACAIASIYDKDIGHIREQLEPVRKNKSSYEWIDDRKAVAWTQSNLYDNLAYILKRRFIEVQKKGRGYPLGGAYNADISDIISFINGELDEGKIADLLFGLSTIQWFNYEYNKHKPVSRGNGAGFSPYFNAYAITKLVFPERSYIRKNGKLQVAWKPEEIEKGISIKYDVDILTLLSHSPERAIDMATRRLRAHGFVPMGAKRSGVATLDFDLDRDASKRILASLLIPVWNYDRLAKAVLRNDEHQLLVEMEVGQEKVII